MKGKKGCMKKGGGVMSHEGLEKKEEHEAQGKKHGGHVKKAHEAHGKKAKMRVDKRARGGKVATPKSPLSGAEPKGMPEGVKAQSAPCDKEMD